MGIKNCFVNKHTEKWNAKRVSVQKLIEEAKKGNVLAILELRLRYDVTALWNGQRLTPISEFGAGAAS